MARANAGAPEAQEITSPAGVAQLLTRLLDNRCQLGIRLPGAPAICSTILLEVDYAGGNLLLDEIYPAAGNEYARAGALVRVQGRIDGSRVEFECIIDEITGDEGAPAYRATLPSRVRYFERRGSYRLTIPPELKLPPALFSAAAGPLAGRLVDISRDGAGTLVEQAEADVGAELACTFALPDARFSAEVEVRSARNGEDGMRLGLEFRSLDPSQRAAVDRAIAALERTLLRHQVNARWM